MMVAPTSWLPQLYQRFQPFWDRAVAAAGLPLLLWVSAEATGTFPNEWRIFMAVGLFLLGLARPGAAYVAFTFLIAYPLYRISIYLAAIVLAALILTSYWAIQNLSATVLVLVTPALLPWHLEAAVPLLAGLWWGEVTGALVGGLSALWLKLLAGMAGQPSLDLAQISGWTPAGANVVERFSPFNSLETLLGLVNPFRDTSQALLLHVLQVLSWALAGWLAGRLAQRTWSDRWRGWAPLLSAVPAGAVIWIGHLILPGLLDQSPVEWGEMAKNLALWTFTAAIVAATARGIYLYLRRPVVRPARRPLARHRERAAGGRSPTALGKPEQRPAFNWKPPDRSRPAAESDDDVIMLEID